MSNWGRWGDDDELGTVNFITPAVRKAAAGLVQSGRVIDLGMPFGMDGPQSGRGRFNPIHTMTMLPTDPPLFPDGFITADDVVTMPLQCATQWDSLAHVGYDGLLYNNTPASAVSAFRGATRNSFDQVVSHMISRGVLLDIAGLKGVDRLAQKRGRSRPTIWMRLPPDREWRCVRGTFSCSVPVGISTTPRGTTPCTSDSSRPAWGSPPPEWLHDHEVAAVCGDNFAVECLPSTEEGASLPLHMVLIRDLGMTLGEMFNFEQLAADCIQDGAWEFLFSGIGLKVTASVGSPITPVVVK